MIKHEMGDALPPTFGFGKPRSMQIIEFQLKDLAGKVQCLSVPVSYGDGALPVHKNLRSEYWVAVKMHNEFAALAKLHGARRCRTFTLIDGKEVVGTGHYNDSHDAYDRAYIDCMMREVAAVEYGRKVMVANLIDENIPAEAYNALIERTGTTCASIELPKARRESK
jgi:hypothetical protein